MQLCDVNEIRVERIKNCSRFMNDIRIIHIVNTVYISP